MTILTLSPVKFHLGWACYAKVVRSSLNRLVSHCTTPGGRTTHLLFGAQDSHSSFEGIPESRNAATIPESKQPYPMSYPSGNRQYNCRGLCQQEEGHSVTISVPTGFGTVVLLADPRFMGDSPSLIRSVECGSRCSFEGVQHAHRVDASEGCLPGHSTPLLCSENRPV